MTTRWQQGYKPIQTNETGLQDPLSVRYMRHMEDNINSTIVAVSPKVVSQVWPGGNDATLGVALTLHGIWGPFWIPEIYDVLSWTIATTSEAGVAINWMLSSKNTGPYDGLYSVTYLDDSDATGYIPGVQLTAMKRSLKIQRGANRATWISLMAETNSNSSVTPPRVYTLDVTAEAEQAYQ